MEKNKKNSRARNFFKGMLEALRLTFLGSTRGLENDFPSENADQIFNNKKEARLD